MPIYEYQCPHCRKRFEEWLKSDDDASTHPCPTCGESSPRIISQSTFILKGGGWYVTEYGSHHTESEAASSEAAQGMSDTADTPKDTGAGSEKAAADKAAGGSTSAKSETGTGTKSAPAKDSTKAAPAPKNSPKKPAAKAS